MPSTSIHSATVFPDLDQDLQLALRLSLKDLEESESQGHSIVQDDDFDYHDSYEDDDFDVDDIHLAPPPARKHRSRTKRRSSSSVSKAPLFTKIVQPIIDSPRPLRFPLEVLALVCRHLSQPALRSCVSLVCKDWNRVSDAFLRRVGVWTPLSESYHGNKLLEQMEKKSLDTLECWFKMDPYIPYDQTHSITTFSTREAWLRFHKAILAPLDAEPSQQLFHDNNRCPSSEVPTCLFHYIQHLWFCSYNIGCDLLFTPLLPYLCHLKTLYLNVYFTIPVIEILDHAHNLIEFTVRISNSRPFVNMVTGDPAEDSLPDDPPPPPVDPDTAHFPVKPKVVIPPKTYDDRYKLRVFDIDRCIVKQRVLERIVGACPDLRIFKARGVNKSVWDGQRYITHDINQPHLIEHVKKMCPRLEWYNVIQDSDDATDGAHIKRIHNHFPDQTSLSISCSGYQNDLVQNDIVRTMLRQITTLEVTPAGTGVCYSEILNDVLCLMPQLQHFLGPRMAFEVSALYLPPTIEVPEPKKFIENNKERKRQEREERRRQRQEALSRFQNSGYYQRPPTGVPEIDPSCVWACRDLRTFNLKFESNPPILLFTEYIHRHKLFRSLTHLRIEITRLMMGQLKFFPHVYKRLEKSLEKAKGNHADFLKMKEELEQPPRHEDVLRPLRGLMSLEEFKIDAEFVDGMLHASDFEFLRRRKGNETVVRYISHETPATGPHVADKNEYDEEDEGMNEHEEESGSGGRSETIWPRLQALHIRYLVSRLTTDFRSIIARVEAIRPGVEFSIRERYSREV
ncbi:hypothetical protein EDD11_007166 [Mortierella claussenii]|nr:hypothetical protein EDD11_007166 [Mortierella claussenii]